MKISDLPLGPVHLVPFVGSERRVFTDPNGQLPAVVLENIGLPSEVEEPRDIALNIGALADYGNLYGVDVVHVKSDDRYQDESTSITSSFMRGVEFKRVSDIYPVFSLSYNDHSMGILFNVVAARKRALDLANRTGITLNQRAAWVSPIKQGLEKALLSNDSPVEGWLRTRMLANRIRLTHFVIGINEVEAAYMYRRKA